MWWLLAGSGSDSDRHRPPPSLSQGTSAGTSATLPHNPITGSSSASLFSHTSSQSALEVHTQKTSHHHKHKGKGYVNKWQIMLLGISLVTAGDVMFWNSAYAYLTFREYLMNVLILGSAFVIAAFCLAELTGTLPFAGKFFIILKNKY